MLRFALGVSPGFRFGEQSGHMLVTTGRRGNGFGVGKDVFFARPMPNMLDLDA